jgi:hypothetical protein
VAACHGWRLPRSGVIRLTASFGGTADSRPTSLTHRLLVLRARVRLVGKVRRLRGNEAVYSATVRSLRNFHGNPRGWLDVEVGGRSVCSAVLIANYAYCQAALTPGKVTMTYRRASASPFRRTRVRAADTGAAL